MTDRIAEPAAIDGRLATPDGDVWFLEFKALPSGVPEVHRYRALLKHALRTLDLKCVGIHGEPGERPVTSQDE